MPTMTARENRATWFDEIPDYLRDTPVDALYTREEVIGSLRDRGVDVNEVTLAFWEKSGVLPRPIRRRRDGAPKALYPPWAVDAIVELRRLQAQGRTLDQIRPLMQAHRLAAVVWQDPISGPMNAARSALLTYAQALEIDLQAIEGITITYTGAEGETLQEYTFSIPVELRQTLQRRQVGD